MTTFHDLPGLRLLPTFLTWSFCLKVNPGTDPVGIPSRYLFSFTPHLTFTLIDLLEDKSEHF